MPRITKDMIIADILKTTEVLPGLLNIGMYCLDALHRQAKALRKHAVHGADVDSRPELNDTWSQQGRKPVPIRGASE